MAEAYERDREERVAIALQPIIDRNEGIEELLSQFVKKGDRDSFRVYPISVATVASYRDFKTEKIC